MANRMPCSTPIATTAAAVRIASRNSPRLSRRMSRRPRRSTMPTAMVKTMLASTQRGRYCSGPVRNRSTTSTIAAKASCAAWLRAPGRVGHRRLGRAAVDDEGATDRGGRVGRGEPENVGVLVDPLLMLERVGARRRRALGDDHHEARRPRPAGGPEFRSSRPSAAAATASRPEPARSPQSRAPRGRSQALAAIVPTTTTSATGNLGAKRRPRRMLATTTSDRPRMRQSTAGRPRISSQSCQSVCRDATLTPVMSPSIAAPT